MRFGEFLSSRVFELWKTVQITVNLHWNSSPPLMLLIGPERTHRFLFINFQRCCIAKWPVQKPPKLHPHNGFMLSPTESKGGVDSHDSPFVWGVSQCAISCNYNDGHNKKNVIYFQMHRLVAVPTGGTDGFAVASLCLFWSSFHQRAALDRVTRNVLGPPREFGSFQMRQSEGVSSWLRSAGKTLLHFVIKWRVDKMFLQ